LESKSFPVIKQQGKIYFIEFKFVLNPFGAFCKNLQKKTGKEKRKEKGKRVKGCGEMFRPGIRRSPRPNYSISRTGTAPPPSLLADLRAPAVSTDAFIYLQTKITRGITARDQIFPS
jgi:hypothetical protein